MGEVKSTSMAAVFQLTCKAVNACSELHGVTLKLKNPPEELVNLHRDLAALIKLLANLQNALEPTEAQNIVDRDEGVRGALGDLIGLIASCTSCCVDLKRRIYDGNSENNSKGEEKEEGLFLPCPSEEDGSDIRQHVLTLQNRRGIFSAVDNLQKTRFLLLDLMGRTTLDLVVQTAALRKNKNEAASNPVAKPFDNDIGSAISDWLVSQPAERNSSSSADEWALISPSKPEPSDPEMVEDFFIAVKGGSIRMASILFKLVDINTQDLRTGRTALSFAAENGNATMARLLLENGASVHIRQYSRRFCAERGDPTELAGRNALIWAATGKRTEMVELLLQYGANPNSANTLGQSALLEACSQDDEDTFRLLVEHGADINFKRFYYGWRPINLAADRYNRDIKNVIMEYNPLLNVPVEYHGERKTPLHYAIRDEDEIFMEQLLKAGADPNIRGLWENNTPLHMAATAGWMFGVRLLPKFNASIDPVDAFHFETPLHKAARHCNARVCEILCEHGANTKRKNVDGQNYQDILQCARRYPDKWELDPELVYFLCA